MFVVGVDIHNTAAYWLRPFVSYRRPTSTPAHLCYIQLSNRTDCRCIGFNTQNTHTQTVKLLFIVSKFFVCILIPYFIDVFGSHISLQICTSVRSITRRTNLCDLLRNRLFLRFTKWDSTNFICKYTMHDCGDYLWGRNEKIELILANLSLHRLHKWSFEALSSIWF